MVREPVMVIVKVEGSLMLLVTQASDNVKSELSLVKVPALTLLTASFYADLSTLPPSISTISTVYRPDTTFGNATIA